MKRLLSVSEKSQEQQEQLDRLQDVAILEGPYSRLIKRRVIRLLRHKASHRATEVWRSDSVDLKQFIKKHYKKVKQSHVKFTVSAIRKMAI